MNIKEKINLEPQWDSEPKLTPQKTKIQDRELLMSCFDPLLQLRRIQALSFALSTELI